MSTAILRTRDAWWAETPHGVVKINTPAATTAGLLADRDAISAAGGPAVPLGDLDLLSPVTAPCRVVAQAVNFRSHALGDAGFRPLRDPDAADDEMTD
jgi:hypothetical protein